MSKSEKKDATKKKHAGGRPTIFTLELAALICERVATHTFGLQRLCQMYDDMPVKSTINKWRYENSQFSTQYATAKMFQAELMAEEIIDIADDATNDWMEKFGNEGENLGWQLNGEHVQRSRLRIDTRKWQAAKLAPKIYGVPQQEDKERKQSEIEKMLLNSD